MWLVKWIKTHTHIHTIRVVILEASAEEKTAAAAVGAVAVAGPWNSPMNSFSISSSSTTRPEWCCVLEVMAVECLSTLAAAAAHLCVHFLSIFAVRHWGDTHTALSLAWLLMMMPIRVIASCFPSASLLLFIIPSVPSAFVCHCCCHCSLADLLQTGTLLSILYSWVSTHSDRRRCPLSLLSSTPSSFLFLFWESVVDGDTCFSGLSLTVRERENIALQIIVLQRVFSRRKERDLET